MLQFISMEQAFGEIEERASRQSLPTALVPLEDAALDGYWLSPQWPNYQFPHSITPHVMESFYQLQALSVATRRVGQACCRRASRR